MMRIEDPITFTKNIAILSAAWNDVPSPPRHIIKYCKGESTSALYNTYERVGLGWVKVPYPKRRGRGSRQTGAPRSDGPMRCQVASLMLCIVIATGCNRSLPDPSAAQLARADSPSVASEERCEVPARPALFARPYGGSARP
jgi:hypothetical protein